MAEFSRRIPKTQQTLSQLVARLEKLGLIERRLGPGRGVGLHLTEAGRELATEAVAREQEVNTRLRDLLGAERAAALADLLRETRTVLREPADAGQRARRVDGRRTAAVSSTESGFPAATGCQLRHC